MRYSANEALAAYQAATDEGEREYWTRQIIICEVRAHRQRNNALLKRAQMQLAAVVAATLIGSSAAMAAFVWLSR